jgi:hypothetical protein
MNRTKLTIDAGVARFWSTVFSGVTTVGLVLGGLGTIIGYFISRSKDRDEYHLQSTVAQAEANKPFFTHHLEICIEASSAASTIGSPTAAAEDKKKAVAEFQRLFYGPMVIVEGDKVRRAMVYFSECLPNVDSCVPTTEWRADLIAQACRDEETENWNLNLAPKSVQP